MCFGLAGTGGGGLFADFGPRGDGGLCDRSASFLELSVLPLVGEGDDVL